MNKVLIAIDKSKMFRVYLTISTEMVEEARKIHQTTPVATAGLGRALTGGGLMGVMLKEDNHKVTLNFKGDGQAKQILVTANGKGEVKGYISNPNVDLEATKEGKLDVGGSLGIGELTVIKDIGLKDNYVGSIAFVTGEIADDLTAYFFISEQQNTSVALGVKLDKEAKVKYAGGMIIQMMPGFIDESVDALEKILGDMKPLTSIIEEVSEKNKGKNQEGVLKALLEEIFKEMPEEYTPEVLDFKNIDWECDCNRERLKKVIMTIGKKDLKEIIEEDGKAEMVCQFCESKYNFDKDELTELLNSI